ncbi:MAG: D-amino acid dehydrogenase [Betaproteobacteria bacterium]
MRIIVLGAGVIGTATAWYLAREGHEVTVIDRQSAAGMETSFANGGQISVSHAEPWANPHVLPKALRWLGREDAPLLVRWRFDPAFFSWGLRFLGECLPTRTRKNIGDIVRLALYSRERLQALRQEIDLDYDCLGRGILHIYTDQAEFDAAVAASEVMREFGLDRAPVSVDHCLEIEPALALAKPLLVGGDFTPSDESGDAHRFTQVLSRHCQERGVVFRYDTSVERIAAAGGRVTGVVVRGTEGHELLSADAYVAAAGSYTPLLLKRIGIRLPIYPAKGYSATVALSEDSVAPTVALTDDARKIVTSRLGNRLRIAGTAEFNGYNLDLTPIRCRALIQRVQELFPELRPAGEPEYWCGLRPTTPSNVPYVGATRYPNLWLNSGHGTLGWTMACGSGAALADLIAGRDPGVTVRGEA